MDYSAISAPFIENGVIRERVRTFREKYFGSQIPIDIEHIVEIGLELDVIPISELMNLTNMDAFLTSDFKSIGVDKKTYDDERFHNRLRYSLAHEIAHLVLHRQLYKSLEIKSIEDVYKLNEEIETQTRNRLEFQANQFANFLLIPRTELERRKEIVIKKITPSMKEGVRDRFEEISTSSLNQYLAIPLSKQFLVSEETMTIALNDIF